MYSQTEQINKFGWFFAAIPDVNYVCATNRVMDEVVIL